jgi:hypothetical protein
MILIYFVSRMLILFYIILLKCKLFDFSKNENCILSWTEGVYAKGDGCHWGADLELATFEKVSKKENGISPACFKQEKFEITPFYPYFICCQHHRISVNASFVSSK